MITMKLTYIKNDMDLIVTNVHHTTINHGVYVLNVDDNMYMNYR